MGNNRFLRGPSVTDYTNCLTMADPLFFTYLPQGFKLLRIHPEYYDTTYVFEYDGKIYDLYLESDTYGYLTCLKADTDKDSDFIDHLSQKQIHHCMGKYFLKKYTKKLLQYEYLNNDHW